MGKSTGFEGAGSLGRKRSVNEESSPVTAGYPASLEHELYRLPDDTVLTPRVILIQPHQ